MMPENLFGIICYRLMTTYSHKINRCSQAVMKKILIINLILLLFSTISLSAQVYKFPLKISTNNRYLTDQKGKPFFYNGDTGWKLFLKLNKAEVIEYLTDRKQKKFTVIQTMLTGFAGEKNIFGNKPFTDSSNFSTVN